MNESNLAKEILKNYNFVYSYAAWDGGIILGMISVYFLPQYHWSITMFLLLGEKYSVSSGQST